VSSTFNHGRLRGRASLTPYMLTLTPSPYRPPTPTPNLSQFEVLWREYAEARNLVPDGNLIEISYAELTADPAKAIGRVYNPKALSLTLSLTLSLSLTLTLTLTLSLTLTSALALTLTPQKAIGRVYSELSMPGYEERGVLLPLSTILVS
jgi:hypothetical protein